MNRKQPARDTSGPSSTLPMPLHSGRVFTFQSLPQIAKCVRIIGWLGEGTFLITRDWNLSYDFAEEVCGKNVISIKKALANPVQVMFIHLSVKSTPKNGYSFLEQKKESWKEDDWMSARIET